MGIPYKNGKELNNRSMVEKKCYTCKRKFMREFGRVKNKMRVFCSRQCAGVTSLEVKIIHKPRELKGKNIVCLQCNQKFYVEPSRIKKAKFCSVKCTIAWQTVNQDHTNLIRAPVPSGKDHPHYKHGNSRKSQTNYKIRRLVNERDGGNWCLFCGKPGPGLHLHRVMYGSQGGKYEVNNCMELCAEHHALVHSNKKLWQPKLLDYLQTGLKEFQGNLLNQWEGSI